MINIYLIDTLIPYELSLVHKGHIAGKQLPVPDSLWGELSSEAFAITTGQ